MTQVQFQYRRAGFCYSSQHHALRGGERKTIPFPATFGILQHPTQGLVLFDTGYTDRFFEETARFPASIYAKATPVTLPTGETAVEQVIEMGYQPDQVAHIIVSHFHADHVGGLRDFPKATFYCSSAAWDQVQRLNGFAALRRALLKGLLPDDIASRIQLIDQGFCAMQEDAHLGTIYDLWGDGSIRLVDLPGHAAGQIGALLNTPQGEVFLIADAAWQMETVQAGTLPVAMVKLFFDSWSDFKASLQKVRNYAQAHPETLIVPCHDEAVRQQLMQAKS